MKTIIIQALKNTFGLNELDDISQLNARPEVSSIKGLADLLQLLMADERTPPKIIAEAVETVTVHIKMKKKPTAEEKELLSQIKELVDEPLYTIDQSFNTLRRS